MKIHMKIRILFLLSCDVRTQKRDLDCSWVIAGAARPERLLVLGALASKLRRDDI